MNMYFLSTGITAFPSFSYSRPKSDTCKVCDTMKVRVEAEQDFEVSRRLQGEWNLHKRKAERAYQQLREDTAEAQSDTKLDMITFDLQQSLPTPLLSVNVVYYKRQLWTYNLGVHCCATGTGFMNVWDESVGSRGSQEIGSCVLTYLREHQTPAEHLIAYSDSCGGQNRNVNFVCLWQHVVSSSTYSYEVIDHKFMMSGHSYLPNDRDFGGIEKVRRRTSAVYVPSEWCTLIKNARRVNPFQVRVMTPADFVSTANLTAMIVNRKTNTVGDSVKWLNIHWIRVEKDCPLSFKYRYTLNDLEPWKKVDMRPKRAGRPLDMGRAEMSPLYCRPRQISAPKLKDLKQLLCYIPPVHHDFYNALTANDDSVEN